MIKVHFFSFLLFCFCLTGCNSKKNTTVSENSNAVIIFDGFYKNSVTNDIGVKVSVNPVLSIDQLSQNFINQTVLERSNEKDTFRIEVAEDKILLTHMGVEFDKLNFLLSKGDTLVIKYNDNYPLAKLLSKDSLTLSRINEIRIKPEELLSTVLFESDLSNYFSKEKYLDQRREVILAYENQLDSLFDNNLISADYYDLEKSYIFYSQEYYEFSTRKNKISNTDEINFEDSFQNEKYLRYPFYQYYIKQQYEALIDVPLLNVSNGTIWDYRTYYDSLDNISTMPEKTKEYLKYVYLDAIAQEFDKENFEFYFNQFFKDSPDTNYIRSIKERYLTDFLFDSPDSTKNDLISIEKNIVSFDSLLSKHRGNVVYIDFWASWCSPCIRAFPDINNLQKEFSGKNFKVIYISLDNDYEKWLRSIKKYDLIDESNFLGLNNPIKNYTNNKNISIPRYFLFSPEGHLISSNAPKPESRELRHLVLEYLHK